VTFNMECVVKEIASTTDVLSDPFGVLLFGQVQAMLNIIGTDGLEAAAATTAVTDADCSDCDAPWCYTWDFTLGDGDWVIRSAYEGVYGASGWESDCDPSGSNRLVIERTITPPSRLISMSAEFDYVQGGDEGDGDPRTWYLRYLDSEGNYIASANGVTPLETGTIGAALIADVPAVVKVQVNIWASQGVCNGSVLLTDVTLRGIGVNPFGDDNCI